MALPPPRGGPVPPTQLHREEWLGEGGGDPTGRHLRREGGKALLDLTPAHGTLPHLA